MTDLLALITARVDPSRRHLVTDDATLAELGWGEVDSWGLLDDVERQEGRELDWSVARSWQSVADIHRSFERTVLERVDGQ